MTDEERVRESLLADRAFNFDKPDVQAGIDDALAAFNSLVRELKQLRKATAWSGNPYCEIHDTAHHAHLHSLERELLAVREVVEAASTLLAVVDHLLDAGNPQDWTPVSAASNRLRVALSNYEEVKEGMTEHAKATGGLRQKYVVERVDGRPVGWCFVLEGKDPLAIPALLAYAMAADRYGRSALADDLRVKVRDLEAVKEG